jgi:FkbM family methyltransferase
MPHEPEEGYRWGIVGVDRGVAGCAFSLRLGSVHETYDRGMNRFGPPLIDRLVTNGAAPPLRWIFNRVVGTRRRRVRVASGAAKGTRLELDLTREKAYWLGHYERVLQDWLRRNLAPGAVMFDVGAHIGFVSVCAAQLGARVVAVEPLAENAARVRRHAVVNGLPITVVEAAAWDRAEGVTVVAGSTSSEGRVESDGEVTGVTLDALVAAHGAPDVVKIDVEGAAGRVLRGAAALVASRSAIIVCELHGPDEESEVRELLGGYVLEPLGGPARLVARPSQPVPADAGESW